MILNNRPLSEQELCPDRLLLGQEVAFGRDIKNLQKNKKSFVPVSCPACKNLSSNLYTKKCGFIYQQCKICETIYMSPRPPVKIMEKYYKNSENYKYWAKYIFPFSEKARREKISYPWLKYLVKFCRTYKVQRNFLIEIGSGFGTFSALAQEKKAFKKVVAIEPTPQMADACRQKGVKVLQESLEKVGKSLKNADAVVAFEVIEHLFNPRDLFKIAYTLLKEKGILAISCPNGLGFEVSTLRQKSLTIDAEHVNLFNPRSLKILGEASKFKCKAIETPGRLDVEFVKDAVKKGRFSLKNQPFLQKVIHDQGSISKNFQLFLAKNKISSHMCAIFQK